MTVFPGEKQPCGGYDGNVKHRVARKSAAEALFIEQVQRNNSLPTYTTDLFIVCLL
jgi:hypothetical protein